MNQSTGPLKSRQPQTFLFRANAVAAGGYLTKLKGVVIQLDPQHVTVHGESNLPMIGGISQSLVENPELRFPEFISYNQCSTVVEGFGDARSATTNLRAAVNNVRMTTSPSPSDAVPDLQSISFQATNLSISSRSIYPVDDHPSFQLPEAPVTTGMSLVLRPFNKPSVVVPIRLEVDKTFLAPSKMDDLDKRFMEDREFFDNHVIALQSGAPLSFGKSRFPRTAEGYVRCSFVTKVFRGNQEIRGNVLVEKGFGTITFGTVVTDSYSRRVDLVRIRMGSDPEGQTDFCGACNNGIWS
jgi:hypothetical protein